MKPQLFRLFVAYIVLITGCDSKSTPECTNLQVQRMAVENALETIIDDGNKIELIVYLKNDPKAIAEFEKMNKQANLFGYSDYFSDLATFSNLFTSYNFDNELKTVVDSALNDGIIFLDGIRVNGIDKKIKKCDCGATINLGNFLKYYISYTAQYTEDDKVYVTTTVDSEGEKE